MLAVVYFLIILLAAWALIKTVFYGLYEIRECENEFGGVCCILFAVSGFVLFASFIFLQ